MEVGISPNTLNDASAMETHTEVDSPEELDQIFASASLGFNSWTHLISEIEKTYQDSIKTISLVYDSFLSNFPLCHEYWTRYADHKARLCTVAEAVEVFERAVQSATYAVGLWVDYCNFSMIAFAEPSDIRRTFERGLSLVGKDFLSHTLWDMYIKFEYSQQQWSSLAHILIRALKFPTKSLHKYYDNFREFSAFIEEDVACHCNLEPHSAVLHIEVVTSEDEMCKVIKEMQESSNVELRFKALHKYIATGERFYGKACQLHEEIDQFENYMDREFFDIKPLDEDQLKNWHNYLDFIEKQEDFDWGVKLYERCLIPCANYPEFWMRYVDFMESKGGRELASYALERATQVFLKDIPEVHIFNARFREQIGDIEEARAAFLQSDTGSDSSFVETAIKKANMEKRLGNLATASEVYEKALKVAAEQQKLQIIPVLYINFYRLKYLITGSADAARDLLIDAIQRIPDSRLLLEELINFVMMHEGSTHLNVVDPIIATAISGGLDESQGLSSKDREDLSCLYLKFVDHCGTTHDMRKAWNRHIKSFPHMIRTNSSLEHSTGQHLNEPTERILHLIANQQSRGHVLDSIVEISENEQELLLSENLAIQPQETMVNQYEKEDNNCPEKEKRPESSLQVLQSKDDAVGYIQKFKHQSNNDASISTDSVVNAVGPSQEDSSFLPQDFFGMATLELQKKLKIGSLERLAEGNESQDLTPSSCTSLGDIHPSTVHGNPSTATGRPYSVSASDERRKNLDGKETEIPSSSLEHRNLIRGQTDSQQEIPLTDAETSRKLNHVVAASEAANSEFNGKSQHWHQQHKDSPPIQGSQMGSKVQEPNKNQANVEGNIASNSWTAPSMQPPNSSSASTQPVYPQPLAQTYEQAGQIQNAQSYNDMWHYHNQYQQWLQMQQSYFQPPYLQPQQHYGQQLPMPYPPDQLQQQQYQLYQQHEQYHQYQAWLYHQQQELGYQQWIHHHQWQEYFWFQQHQHQQPQDGQQNHQQQVSAVPSKIWNASNDQQGQMHTQPHKSTNVTTQPTNDTSLNHPQPSILGAPPPILGSSGPSESLRATSSQQKPKT